MPDYDYTGQELRDNMQRHYRRRRAARLRPWYTAVAVLVGAAALWILGVVIREVAAVGEPMSIAIVSIPPLAVAAAAGLAWLIAEDRRK